MRRLPRKAPKPALTLIHAAFDAHCYVKSPGGHPWRIRRGGIVGNGVRGLVIHPEGKPADHRCIYGIDVTPERWRVW